MRDDRRGRAARADGDRARRPPEGFRARSRERFAQLSVEALLDLPAAVAHAAGDAELLIADVPPPPLPSEGEPRLADFSPARPGVPARLTLYRRAIELRAVDRADLTALIVEAAIDAVADALGHPPDLDEP